MFACARCALVRFQPYAMAVQTRFKWRHKETDRWRRLMDATCFQLDWLGQTRGPNFSQYSGHWTHILTCAHVITPWNYPNFYPPTGPTRFVTHITLADTMTQIRLPSLQGTAVYKHFTSNQHVYAHSNPRLDLCVLHAEQNLRRSGEMKMLWLQNEGYVIRPRLELVTPLCVGDVVWMYGMHAQESLFDEEKAPEPRMVPVGLRARVLHLTREHFFLDTLSMNGGDGGGLSGNSAASHAGGDEAAAAAGEVGMGMCGSVIMRHGRCVGMLTATVHRESSCRELAGAAMCTYAHDIFEFLLEVEKQMKNPVAPLQQEETVFQKRRRCDEPTEEEASHPKQSPCSHDGSRRETQSDDTEEHGSRRRRHTSEHRDWELDGTRIAHHIPVPVSLWHMEEKWITEEDHITNAVFGRSGVFNQETQESALHLDMNSAKSSGERPHEMPIYSAVTRGNKVTAAGERKDYSPRGVYTEDSRAFRSSDDVWERNVQDEVDSLFRQSVDDKCVHNLDALRQSLERIRNQRATEKMTETVLKYSGGHEDPLNMGMGTGHYQASAHAGAANFSPRSRTEEEEEEKEKTMPRYHSSADKNDCTSGCRVNERRCDVAASSSAQRAEGSYKGGREVCGETRSTLHHGEGCPAQGIAAEGQSTSSEGGCRDMSHTDAAMHHIRRSSHDERHSDSSHSTATSTLRRVHAANIARKKRERDEGEAKARADLERCHKRPVEVHSDEMMYTVWRSSGQ